MKDEYFKALNIVKKDLENKGYEVLGIGIYGSQNYNLQDDKSDIDMRAIIMPSLKQIITRNKVSKKYITDYGDVDVKDLLTYYEVIRKGNFSFIEPLQSQWYIGDKYIKNLFANIPLNLKSVKGAMYEKAKAFRHPYPSKMEEINKWGFDPKQIHHIFRLLSILANYDISENKSFIYYKEASREKDKVMYDEREFLINTKRNINNTVSKRNYSDEDIQLFISEADTYIPKDYKYIPVDLYDEIMNIIINNLKIKLSSSEITSARQYRTFGATIPKRDLQSFPILKNYKNKDISYIVYEHLEIL